jgi:hypothetical protein
MRDTLKFFKDVIDDITASDYTLSQAEMSDSYNKSLLRFKARLKAENRRKKSIIC